MRRGVTALALAALGVVFGDIGTSPLYALKTVFTHRQRRRAGDARTTCTASSR